jgi:hypothetical protein
MQAGGVGNDFSAAPLLSAAGGLYQAYTGAQSAQKTSNNQQNAFTTASNAGNFGNFNFSSPTGTANMGGYGLSPGLTTAANQDASNAGTFGKLAAQYGSGGLPAGVQTSLNNVNSAYGADSTALNKLAGQVGTGMTGAMGLYGAGQGVMGAGAGYTNAAQGIIANQGTNFDQTYQTALKTQMDALKNPQQQQMSQLQDQEFGRGMLGTSGGALQTQAMATGFGQADIQAQSTAMNQALQQYGLGTQAASAYGNLGSNTLSIGGGLMNNALSTYGNLASLGGNLTNSIYNMASSNFGTNANASMLPGQLAGQYSNLAGSSTNQASTLNSMGLAQYNAGLTGQNDVNNAMQRSAATQGAISLNGNYSPGNSGYGNMVGQLLGQGTGGLNSPGGGLLGQAGHLVSNLFGGGGNGGGGNGGGVSYDPTAIDPGAGTSFSGTSAPGVDTSGVGNFDPSLYGIGG